MQTYVVASEGLVCKANPEKAGCLFRVIVPDREEVDMGEVQRGPGRPCQPEKPAIEVLSKPGRRRPRPAPPTLADLETWIASTSQHQTTDCKHQAAPDQRVRTN